MKINKDIIDLVDNKNLETDTVVNHKSFKKIILAKPSNISSQKGAENIKSIIKGKLIQSKAEMDNNFEKPLVERRDDKDDGSMILRKREICSESTGAEKKNKKLKYPKDKLELGLKVIEHEKIQRNLEFSKDKLELNPKSFFAETRGDI